LQQAPTTANGASGNALESPWDSFCDPVVHGTAVELRINPVVNVNGAPNNNNGNTNGPSSTLVQANVGGVAGPNNFFFTQQYTPVQQFAQVQYGQASTVQPFVPQAQQQQQQQQTYVSAQSQQMTQQQQPQQQQIAQFGNPNDQQQAQQAQQVQQQQQQQQQAPQQQQQQQQQSFGYVYQTQQSDQNMNPYAQQLEPAAYSDQAVYTAQNGYQQQQSGYLQQPSTTVTHSNSNPYEYQYGTEVSMNMQLPDRQRKDTDIPPFESLVDEDKWCSFDAETADTLVSSHPCPDSRLQLETVTSNGRWVVRVETEVALNACMESLEASVADDPWLCLDFEGENLGRCGKLTMIQICSINSQYPVFVIDVLQLGSFAVTRLKQMIEDVTICKVMFDPRMDVDTLVHHYQVYPQNLLDMQVLDMSMRIIKGMNGSFWLGFHKVIQNLCDNMVDSDNDSMVAYLINAAKTKTEVHNQMSNDPQYFTRRPLSKADYHYAANDVALLSVILREHLKFMSEFCWPEWFRQCKEVSNLRAYEVARRPAYDTALGKSDACCVPSEFQRAFVFAN